jgi:hypothetical protein
MAAARPPVPAPTIPIFRGIFALVALIVVIGALDVVAIFSNTKKQQLKMRIPVKQS